MASPVWRRRRRRQQLRTVLRRIARDVDLERSWNGHDAGSGVTARPQLFSTRAWLRGEPLRRDL